MQPWQFALFAALAATAASLWVIYKTLATPAMWPAIRAAGLRPGPLPADAAAAIQSIIDTAETGGVRIKRTYASIRRTASATPTTNSIWLAELHTRRRPGARSWQRPGQLWIAISRPAPPAHPETQPAALRAVSQEFTIVELTTLTTLPSVDVGPAHVAHGDSAEDVRPLCPQPGITTVLVRGWLLIDAGTDLPSALAAARSTSPASKSSGP
jgi:hypothetical protein